MLGDSLTSALSVSISVSAFSSFVVGLLVGCLTCLCYICWHKQPRGDSNDLATAAADKDATIIYDMIPMDHTEATGKEINIVSNSAYGELSGSKF